ncbi:dihydroorotate dehydrogenase [Blastopirellula marina]|uniref:Dihydroorotate dehydrogenase n=1 Tax=Blastopirellula marina DSM 3645 TaxID=314230 RepID=A4A2Y8_9BACT|nr:dihydroorotate dehydrogenase [Blastopirellula marina]EAQ76867.1 dihydroorotate dehydrogenase [Blastopirellula marina DSM 3645]
MSASLSVEIGSLRLANPILVASGTFGYAREMAGMVDVGRLGGIVPKTITQAPRAGNAPWRTVETTAGLLNSIGLDNDGIDAFIEHHLPYLGQLASPAIVSIAGRTSEEFTQMAARLSQYDEVGAIELNISCPNVSGGVDFGICPETCRDLIASVRAQCTKPLLAKLTPNVARIADVAAAAEEGGADGISAINTLLGMAVDWRRQKPLLGNVMGGLSGPAIKPVALRCVYQIAQRVKIPVIGIGGIGTIDDVMEFLVAGATAVQIGTANFNDPTVSMRLLDQMPAALAELGAASIQEIIGSLQPKSQPAPNVLGSPVA